MATVEHEQPSKHDDFFDDEPAKPTVNGHLSPQPETGQEQVAAEPEVAASADGDEPKQEDSSDPKPQEEEVDLAADSGKKEEESEVGEPTEVLSENIGVDTANDNDVKDTQQEENNKDTGVPEVEAETAQTTEDTEQQQDQQQQEQQQQQQELEQTPAETGDATDSPAYAPSAEPSEGEIPTTPAPPASRQSEYEEDFSETSNITSARNTPAESKPEVNIEKEEDEKVKEKDANKSKSSSSSSSSAASTPEPKQQEVEPAVVAVEPSDSSGPAAPDAPTPRPSTCGGEERQEDGERVDSRAEAGQVIPVPASEPQTKQADLDGRSISAGGDEVADAEVFRGEDRTEMIAPEGSEDCRGQGQWKSAEQQAISAAMLVSKSERELTEEAVKERDTLRQDHEALKTQLLALEAEVDKKNEQILVDKEILARKDKEIADLQSELDNSNSAVASSEADQSRQRDQAIVKDLQERLAILARENEEKDKRVFKLEAELKEAQTRLRETERRLIHAENTAGQEPPKSKTCVIM